MSIFVKCRVKSDEVMRQKRFFLREQDIPTSWYNVVADMPVKPMPMLNPQTREPVTVEDLSVLFSEECSRQELNETDRWIEIPEQVREKYTYYRSTPLVRAYGLEETLGTKARIYFKNESVSPIGIATAMTAIPPTRNCQEEASSSRVTPVANVENASAGNGAYRSVHSGGVATRC